MKHETTKQTRKHLQIVCHLIWIGQLNDSKQDKTIYWTAVHCLDTKDLRKAQTHTSGSKKTVLELRTALVQHVQVKMPIKSESSMGVSLFYPLLKPLGNNM